MDRAGRAGRPLSLAPCAAAAACARRAAWTSGAGPVALKVEQILKIVAGRGFRGSDVRVGIVLSRQEPSTPAAGQARAHKPTTNFDKARDYHDMIRVQMMKRILAFWADLCRLGAGVRRSRPPQNYTPPKTPWGEPDLQGIWPLNNLIATPFQRPEKYGNRRFMTDEEYADAQKRAAARNKRFESGAIPQADSGTQVMRLTSLLVDPPDGRFPALTPKGKELYDKMHGSYKPGQKVFDSPDDFDSWDRCITRGMPVSMLPRNYNNGIRIMQSPGYVADRARNGARGPHHSDQRTAGARSGDQRVAGRIARPLGRQHAGGGNDKLQWQDRHDQRRRSRFSAAQPDLGEHANHRAIHAHRRRYDRLPDACRGPGHYRESMGGGVSVEAGRQVSDVRVRLPRREHGDSRLHRNVAFRAGASEGEVGIEGRPMPRAKVTFDTVREIGLALPDVEDSTMHGKLALKVRGKLLACLAIHKSAEPGSLMVRIDLEQREGLLEEAPEIYYVTDHYRHYAAVLVRLARIRADQLRDLLGAVVALRYE